MKRILIVAGSDSGGGAGIQADIKTVTALGAYAATAVTAITVQDTTGVHAVHPIPHHLVVHQIRAVRDDIGADALKTGMLGDPALIEAVAAAIAGAESIPTVLDPVMVAKGGHPLLAPDAVDALRRNLLPLATLLTPNLPEAAILAGRPVETVADMREAARALIDAGVSAVLLKGGHLAGDALVDILATPTDLLELPATRIPTRHTHGTGCTLASAIAVGLAEGRALLDAVERARAYLRAAIAAAPGFGAGHGPLAHLVTP